MLFLPVNAELQGETIGFTEKPDWLELQVTRERGPQRETVTEVQPCLLAAFGGCFLLKVDRLLEQGNPALCDQLVKKTVPSWF